MPRRPYPRTLRPGAVRPDSDADIREELEFYLAMRTEELVRQGMSPEEAREEAERRFGNLGLIEGNLKRQLRRRQRREEWRALVADLWQDIKFAARSFRRSPGFTVVATLTLALALAGNTTIFSVLDSAVLRALPFPGHERLVFLNGYHLDNGEVAVRYASVPEFRDWRERSRSISPMAAVDPNGLALSGDGRAERVTAEMISQGYFELLGGDPALGRTFVREEYEAPDGYPLAVISHDLWDRRFDRDQGVVGETIRLNERSVTIVGVMGPEFRGVYEGVDVWLPLGMISLVTSVDRLDSRGTRFLGVIGRLSPGVTEDAAQSEMDAIARDLQAEHPDAHLDRFAQVQSFREGYLGETGRLLWILLGAGGLLLAIAVANVANLLLVRAHSRTRELVVRRAVGAAGGRMARQLLTESLLLAVLGGGAGLLLASWGIDALASAVPEGVLPAFVVPKLNARVFLFTLVVVGGTGALAGFVPALSSGRADLAGLLRSGARGIAGRKARSQKAFVVLQVGLALLLLVGAGLLTRSFRAQLRVDPGMEMEGVQVFRLDLPRERYPDGDALRPFHEEVVRRVEAIPGVSSVAASTDFPFRGGSRGSYIVREDDQENLIRYHHHAVTPGYFQNLGVTLLQGRYLDVQDTEDAAGVAVVTRALMERVYPEDPDGLNRTIYIGNPENPENAVQIVGVVENLRYRNLTQNMMEASNSPDVFFTLRQLPARSLEISYRTSQDLSSILPQVREAVAALDPALPISDPATLEDLYKAQTGTPRFAATLMGLLSLMAMVLAAVGIYGVLAFTVSQRAPEIAVRRALGARSLEVGGSVVAGALRLTLLGVVLGGGGALMVGRTLQSFLFQVEPTDPTTFGLVSASMVGVAVLAAVFPAYRATRRDPLEALNSE